MNPPPRASGVQTLTGLLFLCLLVFWSPWTAAQAQETPPLIRSWEFAGNRSIEQDTILSWISLNAGAAFSPQAYQADLDKIRSGYATQGFFEMKITSDFVRISGVDSVADVVIVLDEGRRAVLEDVRFVGAASFVESELQSVAELSHGDAFSVRQLEMAIGRILRWYEQQGYPLARAAVSDITVQEGADEISAVVSISIAEGRKALVTEVRIDGNERTNDEVILRELRLGAGRPFDPDLPSAVRRRLQRLDIFSSVSEPQFYVLEGGDLGLSLTVREGNTNRLDGAVGYIPPSPEGRPGTVTGLIDLGFKNLFGTGRRLDARWRRIDRLSQDLGLRYREPWLFGLPVSVAGGFSQRKQDSSYVQRAFDLAAEVMITEEFSVGLSFMSSSVFPGQLTAPKVTENSSTGFGLFLLYDSRDRSLAPTQGALYQTSYERGTKRTEAGPIRGDALAETRERITADVEAYFLLVRPHVIAVAAHGREIRTPLLEMSDLFRLGGARTLRGYAEDQFLGSRVVWVNMEYRLMAGNRSYLYGFFDWAYVATVSGPESPLLPSEVRPYGYGAGLLVETLLGIIDVSIAAGQGDSFSTAKLHLRLVNEF